MSIFDFIIILWVAAFDEDDDDDDGGGGISESFCENHIIALAISFLAQKSTCGYLQHRMDNCVP